MFGRTSSMHAYFRQAKKRIDQMDAALGRLERAAGKSKSAAQTARLMAEMKKHRLGFKAALTELRAEARAAEARMKKLTQAGGASWDAFRAAALRSRKAFGKATRKSVKAVRRATK